MTKTFRDSARGKASSKVNLEVIANDDGTFELIRNQKVEGSHIAARWLNDELCVKYGSCGREFDEIMRQLAESGRASITITLAMSVLRTQQRKR